MSNQGELLPNATIDDVSDQQILDELSREFELRKVVYKEQILKGKLGREVARARMLILKAAIEHFRERLL